MVISLRLAGCKDLYDINEIYNQAVATGKTGDTIPTTMAARENWFNQHCPDNYPIYVAETDQKIIGWLSFSAYRTGRQAFLHTAEISYYVEEKYLGKGVGKHLIAFALEAAPLFRKSVLLAIILETNVISINLLKYFRFNQWAYLPDIGVMNGKKCAHIYMGICL